MINLKDFNILGLKISSSAEKKDIAMVTGFNEYIQKIENICKTQKGELPSDPYVGSDYYNLIFNPSGIQNLIETDLENYIQYAIKDISNINVRIKYFNDQKVIFAIKFSADTYLKNQLMECTIEVPLQ